MLLVLGSLLLVLWLLSLAALEGSALVHFLLALSIACFVLHAVTKRFRPI